MALNERQEKYAQMRAKGVGKQQSAVLAGYSDDEGAGKQVEESAEVMLRIAELRRQNAASTGVTKEMVLQGFKDAAEMARTLADPSAMVAAWREAGKMLGFYQPEVKRIEKGINKNELLKAMSELSDAELLEYQHGRVIDGDFTRIPDKNLPALPEKLS